MVVLLFLFGLVAGSFLNVVAMRLNNKKTVYWDHSCCPFCDHALSTIDLIPLVSFLFLAGRCRYCNTRISWQYPLVEFGTGLLFGMVAFTFGSNPFNLVFWLFFVASFVIITLYDIRFQMIPDEIVWPLVVGALLYKELPFFAYRLSPIAYSLLPAFVTGGFILFLVLITRERGMGMGDVPIAFLQGLLLGWPKGAYALFLSFIIGAVISILLLANKHATLKTAVPFAPFLIIGLLIMLFW